jgi:hypothetical protein
MQNRFICAALFLVTVAGGACGGASSIPVHGGDEDLGLLAGHWEGTYTGVESGRHGQVLFDLTLGHHVAGGNVMMHAEGSPDAGQALKVEFVDAEHGQVQGKIAPYTDPRCNCLVDTQFTGEVKGDTMSGSFTTKISANGDVQHGTWEAKRK